MERFAYVVGFVVESAWGILPVFLLSVSLGVLVRALKLDGAVRRAFASRVGLSILLATAVGAFSPFCSCTVIPLVAGLLIGGVPLAPVMAFWVASPTMDPEIFALTVGMLGWPLAATRLAATLVLSLAAGYLTLAEILSTTADPAEDEADQRLLKTVRDMLEGLPPEQRAAIYLTEYEGTTQKDLARELGISVSGAKSRVQRARARLKALLLECCHFKLDRRGRMVNYYDRERAPNRQPPTP